jgi:hypothetical protein
VTSLLAAQFRDNFAKKQFIFFKTKVFKELNADFNFAPISSHMGERKSVGVG